MANAREALEGLVAEAVEAVRKSLANHPEAPLPPYGVLLKVDPDTGEAVLMPFTFLDIEQRYDILRTLVEEKQADSFMFLWTGFIRSPVRQDAILFVTATREGEVRGWALPYEHSPISLRFLPQVEAPAGLVAEYGKVFHPKSEKP